MPGGTFTARPSPDSKFFHEMCRVPSGLVSKIPPEAKSAQSRPRGTCSESSVHFCGSAELSSLAIRHPRRRMASDPLSMASKVEPSGEKKGLTRPATDKHAGSELP